MDSSAKQHLLKAYARLLRPLIRILIKNDVAYTEFQEIVKRAYVETTAATFLNEKTAEAAEEVARISGLPEEEAQAILRAIEEEGEERLSINQEVVRVLTGWHTDPEFTGPYGLPLELEFTASAPELSFSTLVQRYGNGVEAEQVLEELKSAGTVRETSKGLFKAVERAFKPGPDMPAGIDHFASTVQNFIKTGVVNLEASDRKNGLFERYVYADDGLRPEDFPAFKAYAEERAQMLLEDIDNWLSKLDSARDSERDDLIDTGFGVYHFIRKQDEEA